MSQEVTVLLFARLRELADSTAIRVTIQAGDTVSELRQAIATTWPKLSELVDRCAVALNGDYADENTVVASEDEIALIPPVSGG